MKQLCDVIAVNIKSSKVRIIASSKSLDNAEAIVEMAASRRGLDEQFFVEVIAGTYKEGSIYKVGKGKPTPEPKAPGSDRLIRIGNTFYPNGPRGL